MFLLSTIEDNEYGGYQHEEEVETETEEEVEASTLAGNNSKDKVVEKPIIKPYKGKTGYNWKITFRHNKDTRYYHLDFVLINTLDDNKESDYKSIDIYNIIGLRNFITHIKKYKLSNADIQRVIDLVITSKVE